jgi:HEAT repeat protein
MIDEPQPQISELDVPAVTASVQDELSTEPLAAETELEATLRELARLDEVNFAQQSTEIELANVQEDTVAPASIEIELAEPKHFVASEKAIQSYDEDSSLARLIENIKTGNTTQRSAAVRELIQTDEEQAFRIITGLFDDGLVDVRNAAALALFQFKRDCAASFTRALREASPERRGHIAAAINGSGLAAQAVDNLIGESREKTYDAFSMLFLMARAGEVKVLLKTIEQHPEVAVRLSVIKLLTFCNQPNIIPAFRSLAVRGTLPTEVRSAVMEAIYQISSNSRENSQSAA